MSHLNSWWITFRPTSKPPFLQVGHAAVVDRAQCTTCPRQQAELQHSIM
jgi:hypothetical protein